MQHHVKTYDLGDRTLRFAVRVQDLVAKLPPQPLYENHKKQVIRAAASVAANYVEANESLGRRDFQMRTKISRKEAKESKVFLCLLSKITPIPLENERLALVQEAHELVLILSAILRKVQEGTQHRRS